MYQMEEITSYRVLDNLNCLSDEHYSPAGICRSLNKDKIVDIIKRHDVLAFLVVSFLLLLRRKNCICVCVCVSMCVLPCV